MMKQRSKIKLPRVVYYCISAGVAGASKGGSGGGQYLWLGEEGGCDST